MTFGSLFSGIGGLDLGLERAGMECKWQIEIDDYCQKVLKKHWPNIPRFKDVKTVHGIMAHAASEGRQSERRRSSNTGSAADKSSSCGENGSREHCPSCLTSVDLICGGFPCQPFSVAGKQRGEEDDRNLWPETLRIIRELSPRYVLLENVPGLIPNAYFDTILDELEDAKYEAWPLVIPAAAFDAPHLRKRVFIVGYAKLMWKLQSQRGECNKWGWSSNTSEDVADTKGSNDQKWNRIGRSGQVQFRRSSWWSTEPNVGRVATRISSRVDRLKGLGNAVVPQVAEWIGRRILESERDLF